MLLLLLTAAAAPPLAMDVVGMEPQLRIVRGRAEAGGWPIVCEGRAGEERVVRIAFPRPVSEAEIDALQDKPDPLGSSTHFYYPSHPAAESCDHEAHSGSAERPVQILAFGPSATLAPLAAIARDCGFSGAVVRGQREGDVPPGIAHAPDPAWSVLDAGEDIGPRHGPAICFTQIAGRTP